MSYIQIHEDEEDTISRLNDIGIVIHACVDEIQHPDWRLNGWQKYVPKELRNRVWRWLSFETKCIIIWQIEQRIAEQAEA